jgi:hypothetical protein
MTRLVLGVTLVGSLAAGVPARADVINAIDSGSYDPTGAHSAQNDNYIAGELSGSERRDFIVFDLTTVVAEIVDASLRLYNPIGPPPFLNGYVSPDATETFTMFDVSTPVDTLRLSQAGAPGVAMFEDLGSGTSLGQIVMSAADNGTTVSILFNDAGVAALNAARGGLFAIGGAVTTLGSPGDEYVFGFSMADFNPDVRQLELNVVPEPATVALLLVGGACIARRRRQSH